MSRFAVYATLLSAWLHRASGQTELGFDAPVRGRTTPDAQNAPGLFIEMFPFASEVRPGDTFRDLGTRCLDEAMHFLRNAAPGLSSPSGAEAGNVVLNFIPATFGDFAGARARAASSGCIRGTATASTDFGCRSTTSPAQARRRSTSIGTSG